MRTFWTDRDIETLKRLYPDTRSAEIAEILNCTIYRIYNKAYQLGLKKSIEFKRSEALIKGLMTKGVSHRFSKGHEPANKGKKWDEFMTPEGQKNSLKTTFRKGHLPHNTKSDNEISLRNDDGYLYKYIRVALGKWQPLHVYNWEKVNGKIPEGYIVVFKSPDKMNCDISNLELITREENMMRNTIHRYPPELKFTIRKLKQLNRLINEKQDSRLTESSL
jgi:hypothetical protein